MDWFYSNRTWMYDRCYTGRGGLKESFVNGVEEFSIKACQQQTYLNENKLRCPCNKCHCTKIFPIEMVKVHLFKNGFMPNYYVWIHHGEQMPHGNDNHVGVSSSGVHVDESEQFMAMQDMVYDALGQHETFEPSNFNNTEEPPNEEAQSFYDLLLEANKPLFEGAIDSKLSICVKLLACKSNWNVPDQCLDFITKMLLDVTPIKEGLPKSYYDAKRLVSMLGLKATRIDCCIKGCMLFYDNEYEKNNGHLLQCKFCHKARYHDPKVGTSKRKPIPMKTMFYLSIIPRLQRLFTSMQTAGQMTWHYDNRRPSGVLRHPSDGQA